MPRNAPNIQFPEGDQFVKVDDELGVVFGWGLICKRDGEPYFDLHNDYAPEEAMLEAAVDFMGKSQAAKEMHVGNVVGQAFVYPLTTDIAKSLNLETKQTGLMLAWKPEGVNKEAALQKFRDGTYTGFSMGGSYVENIDEPTGVAQKGADGAEPTFAKRSCDFEKGGPVKNLHRKRTMAKFTIGEFSAVDKGAQEGAVMTIMKRADAADGQENFEKVMLLTSIHDDHQHGLNIDRYDLRNGGGSTSSHNDGEHYHSHPYVINADGTLTVGMALGHTHDASSANLLSLLSLQAMSKTMGGNKDDEDDSESPDDPKKLPKSQRNKATSGRGKAKGRVKKIDDGKEFVAADYASVPDANDSTTWKYRLVRKSGSNPDKAAVGRAISHFKRDARLRKVTDETTVIRRLRKAWMDSHPFEKSRENMPPVLKRVTS